MEILSPAGNGNALKAAIAAGADAVYLGYAAFSARAGAGNFDEEQLRAAVRLCHLHRVRVHVTVNTLVKDSELDEVLRVLRLLDSLRVDAVLVQDLGVLSLARQCLPGLPIHASTQMAIHNATGAAWCARMGIHRVVLARECSLREIALAAAQPIEVEVFSHGAQCVSVSGECLFSSMLGERSGNRGRCAQPCRLGYTYNGQPGAWLSPRDVCLRDMLPELAGTGACSLKIEGRLKSPAYVSTVTAAYAKANQAMAEGTFAPADAEERLALAQAFHRGGFMKGHAFGAEDAGIIYPDRANHGGVEIGQVSAVRGSLASIRLTRALHDGDQLRAETTAGDYELTYAGPEVPAGQMAELRLRPDAPVRRGDAVFRLVDAQQQREAEALPLPTIPCQMRLTAIPGEALTLTVTAGDCACTVTGEAVAQARSRALTQAEAEASLSKTGDTAFTLTACEVDTADAFVPVSALNALRREALSILTDKRIAAFERPQSEYREPADCVLPTVHAPNVLIFRDVSQLRALPPDTLPVWYPEDFRPEALEAGLSRLPDGCWLHLPMVCEEETLQAVHRFVEAHQADFGGVMLGSVGQLGLAWPVPIAAGSGIPVMNRRAAALLLGQGCAFVTASPELSAAELRTLMAGAPPIVVPAYGRTQLMLLHHCPARTALGLKQGHAACTLCDRHAPEAMTGHSLTDRKGEQFPLQRLRLPEGCLVRLLNSVPTDVRSRVKDIGWPMLMELTDEDILPDGEPERLTRGHWQRKTM